MTQFAFLFCSERSGSNLITHLMNAHPEVCGPAPAHLLRTLALHLSRYGPLIEDRSWTLLTDDVAALLSEQYGAWAASFTGEAIRAAVTERRLRPLLDHVYGVEAAARGKRLVFVKENRTHVWFGFLAQIFPEARYVYLVRDPRDMALSWKLSGTLSGGLLRAARTWAEDQEAWLNLAALLAEEGRIHVLRYEDLIAAPEAELAKVCAFLDLAYAPEMLGFHADRATRADAGRVAAWANLAKPLMGANAGKWRAALSGDEIGLVEAICGSLMGAFGYERAVVAPEPLKAYLARLPEAGVTAETGALSPAETERRRRRWALVQAIAARPPVPAIEPE